MDIVSRLGYSLNSPFKKAKQLVINSNQITMDNTPFPVMAIPDNDPPKMMYPGHNYTFPNSKKVTERRMQDGGQIPSQQPQVDLMEKEQDLLSLHLARLNEKDQKMFLESYRFMDKDEKNQVLVQIYTKHSRPDVQSNMSEMAFKKFQDGGYPVAGRKEADGRFKEDFSPFSMYNQSDSLTNKEVVKAADDSLKIAMDIKSEQNGIKEVQAHLHRNGYSMPKSLKKNKEFDGIIGNETKTNIELFLKDRTGYLVTTGMDRKEAVTKAWTDLTKRSGLKVEDIEKYIKNLPKPVVKTVNKAAKLSIPKEKPKEVQKEKPAELTLSKPSQTLPESDIARDRDLDKAIKYHRNKAVQDVLKTVRENVKSAIATKDYEKNINEVLEMQKLPVQKSNPMSNEMFGMDVIERTKDYVILKNKKKTKGKEKDRDKGKRIKYDLNTKKWTVID